MKQEYKLLGSVYENDSQIKYYNSNNGITKRTSCVRTDRNWKIKNDNKTMKNVAWTSTDNLT